MRLHVKNHLIKLLNKTESGSKQALIAQRMNDKSQRCRKMSIILFLSTQYSQYMFILTPLV